MKNSIQTVLELQFSLRELRHIEAQINFALRRDDDDCSKEMIKDVFISLRKIKNTLSVRGKTSFSNKIL